MPAGTHSPPLDPPMKSEHGSDASSSIAHGGLRLTYSSNFCQLGSQYRLVEKTGPVRPTLVVTQLLAVRL